jgi:Ca-activated chloride channel family protein
MQLDLERQQLYVTVSRSGGRDLELSREDFQIVDNGETQRLVTFERGEVPMTAVVLLDASESMQGLRLPKALEGAKVFLRGLRELDQAMVLLFSDRLLRATSFASDPAVLTAALTGVTIQGGTAVNDHLYLALKHLEAQPGRPVVVLFSDGIDVHSALPMREVLWKLGRSQALLYWILLEGEGKAGGDTISSAWRNGEANKEEAALLRQAVEQSGGQVYPIARPEELVPAFAEILAELRDQYVLGYYPSSLRHDGSWHRVKVEAKPLGVRVRHRGGYVDD